jgi:3-oxoacyl-[acyl-carrier-protein] synthase III
VIIRGARIRAISAAVPPERRGQDYWPDGPKIAKFTGIRERRVARKNILPSDMNVAAAIPLLEKYPRESIDCLIHITQAPDYAAPATSCIVHETLQLPQQCSVFDAVQGCSAYVYGLWMASCILAAGGAKRAMLLVGDINAVPADNIEPTDKATEPLFGDAGTATIIDADPSAPPMTYVNGTDGTGWRFLVVPGSGRRQFGESTKLQMDGAEVFAFTLREIPPLAHAVLAEAGWSIDDCDAVVLHQANKVILDAARTKIGVPAEKFVYGLEHFGNTGGPSVGLALVTEKVKPGKWLLLGFGIGMSWSGLAVDASGVDVYPLVEMP